MILVLTILGAVLIGAGLIVLFGRSLDATGGGKFKVGSVEISSSKPSIMLIGLGTVVVIVPHLTRLSGGTTAPSVPSQPTTVQAGVPGVPGSRPASAPVTIDKRCTMEALHCDRFGDHGGTGWKMGEYAYAARQQGHYEESICLQRLNTTAADPYLSGAAWFEISSSWQALGCVEQAHEAILLSLRRRPKNGKGWDVACAQCKNLGRGGCEICD